MSWPALVAAVTVPAAWIVVAGRRHRLLGRWRSRRRLSRFRSAARSAARFAENGPVGARAVAAAGRGGMLRATPVLAGLASYWVVGGSAGAMLSVLTGIGSWLVIRRMPAAAARRDRQAAAAELPYGVDLLAAALRAGAPLDHALALVGDAIGGSLGRRFDEVGRALRLGVHGEAGWLALADVPGAGGLIPAAIRSADSGAALAAACTRAATELRENRDASIDAAAARAGVLIVLPLGFCFLPAFVLVGVVPILLGVLNDVLA